MIFFISFVATNMPILVKMLTTIHFLSPRRNGNCVNSNNPHGGLFGSGGLFVKMTLGVGAYSGGELIRERGLNRSFTLCLYTIAYTIL